MMHTADKQLGLVVAVYVGLARTVCVSRIIGNFPAKNTVYTPYLYDFGQPYVYAPRLYDRAQRNFPAGSTVHSACIGTRKIPC